MNEKILSLKFNGVNHSLSGVENQWIFIYFWSMRVKFEEKRKI